MKEFRGKSLKKYRGETLEKSRDKTLQKYPQKTQDKIWKEIPIYEKIHGGISVEIPGEILERVLGTAPIGICYVRLCDVRK